MMGSSGNFSRRLRLALAQFGGAVATWALLSVTALVAVQLPAVVALAALPSPSAASFASTPGMRFVPLTERFIRAILGLGPAPAAAPGAGPGAGANPVRAVGSSASRALPGTAVEVTHPFTNDNFRDAYLIPSVPFTAHTNISGATREPGEPADCSPVGGTAWYRYSPPAPLFLRAFLETSFPAAIGVYTGDSVANLKPVSGACNKGTTRNAATAFKAAAGTTYYFQITAISGGGPITFKLFPPGPAELISRASNGTPGNDQSGTVSASPGKSASLDGRYVAFESLATNLDPQHPLGPCNPGADPFQYLGQTCPQVYLRDRVANTTQLVSRSASGQSANGPSYDTSISADGRYVAFSSSGSNLVPGDTNTVADVFVFDRVAGTIDRESVTPSGAQAIGYPGNVGSIRPRLSRDGRYLAFVSDATNLQAGPPCDPATTCYLSLYVRDRLTHSILLESVTPQGQQATDSNALPARWSSDDRYLLFEDSSAELVQGAQATCRVQNNGTQGSGCNQVYRRDVVAGRTVLVSANGAGTPANDSTSPESSDMTGDGRYASFASLADNLVAGDTNNSMDSFRKDMVTGEVLRASVDSSGGQVTDPNPQSAATSGFSAGSANPRWTSISDDGRLLAFDSMSPELDPAVNRPLIFHCFAHDFSSRATILVSSNSSGAAAGGGFTPVLAKDGSIVFFDSTGIDANDKSGQSQVYGHLMTEFR